MHGLYYDKKTMDKPQMLLKVLGSFKTRSRSNVEACNCENTDACEATLLPWRLQGFVTLSLTPLCIFVKDAISRASFVQPFSYYCFLVHKGPYCRKLYFP